MKISEIREGSQQRGHTASNCYKYKCTVKWLLWKLKLYNKDFLFRISCTVHRHTIIFFRCSFPSLLWAWHHSWFDNPPCWFDSGSLWWSMKGWRTWRNWGVRPPSASPSLLNPTFWTKETLRNAELWRKRNNYCEGRGWCECVCLYVCVSVSRACVKTCFSGWYSVDERNKNKVRKRERLWGSVSVCVHMHMWRHVWGGDVAQLVRASDCHVADSARDFSPRVSFQCRLSYMCPHAPMCNRMH